VSYIVNETRNGIVGCSEKKNLATQMFMAALNRQFSTKIWRVYWWRM